MMRKGSARDRAGQRAGKGALSGDGAGGSPSPSSSAAPAESSEPFEKSAQRPRVPDIVPPRWLDQLLVSAMQLPLCAGESAVYDAMVGALAGILPNYAVGACFVAETERGVRGQVVVTRLADGPPATPRGVDPTRIFPWLRREHVLPVPGTGHGATLHVASDEDDLDRESSAAVHLLERAAVALGSALVQCREIAERTDPRPATGAFEERMLQADKLATFGQIAAGLVHELNNPLTSIVAYSDYLIRKAVAGIALDQRATVDTEDMERLRRISESANRMIRFTRDLVTYARPSSGAVAPVVLHSVIDQAVAFCEHVLAGAGARVERRYGPDVLTVRGVSEQLVQVFVNLLTNAAQAAPEQGGVVVVETSLDAAERRIVVAVEDNGTGIAPEHLPQVFAPFFTTKREGHGTGLGLSIVKSIVESHDGEIRVDSRHGQGTRFIIALPTPTGSGG
jgi:signal transduction histidine kinase